MHRAQNELVRLVGDPTLDEWLELAPAEHPFAGYWKAEVRQELRIAMEQRAEVAAAAQRIKAATLHSGIRENQLLPQLSLVLDSTLYGLNGNFNVGRSLVDQFALGVPHFTPVLCPILSVFLLIIRLTLTIVCRLFEFSVWVAESQAGEPLRHLKSCESARPSASRNPHLRQCPRNSTNRSQGYRCRMFGIGKSHGMSTISAL